MPTISPSETADSREWPDWKIQPDARLAAHYLIGLLLRERRLDSKILPAAQIIGRPYERRKYGPLVVASVLELDQLLRTSDKDPKPEDTPDQIRQAALKRAGKVFDELQLCADPEGMVLPDNREYIIAHAEEPDRVVDLAIKTREGLFPEYPGVELIAADAVLALQLQVVNSASPSNDA